jgi:enoyl-CoA hydratase/carnithine racemase
VPELLVSRETRTVTLTLNRPDRRNAVTAELLERLHAELERVRADSDARVVVLQGAQGTFSAGYDLNHLTSTGTPAAGVEGDQVERVCSLIAGLQVPTIAAVDGAASGAGCELALACDVRFASENARFATPPARLGLLHSRESFARLRALVGPAVAKELLFSGEFIDARRALAVGLVNRVVPAERLDEEVSDFASAIAGNAPLSLQASKRLIDGLPADEARSLWREVWASEDAAEGPRAFRERRTPRFHGR